MTAEKDLDLVLGSAVSLPIRYWRPFFFFMGASDNDLLQLSDGRFPLTTAAGKTHPVISLKPLPGLIGFKVCPCSTRPPWRARLRRYIKKGCRLAHTGYVMEKDSYVIEHIEIPIPPDLAAKLSFKGQVPVDCIVTVNSKRR